MLVGVRGLEPPTPWSQTRCASQLRYTPTGDNRSELYLRMVSITRVKQPIARRFVEYAELS
jgi:hypothetical protein